jgi:hypothetical protein
MKEISNNSMVRVFLTILSPLWLPIFLLVFIITSLYFLSEAMVDAILDEFVRKNDSKK